MAAPLEKGRGESRDLKEPGTYASSRGAGREKRIAGVTVLAAKLRQGCDSCNPAVFLTSTLAGEK